MKARFLSVAAACGLLLGITAVVHAQVATGVIEGTVVDIQGGVLPGVSLTVHNVETGLSRTIVSDEGGRYRLPALPPSIYVLTAELPGFATAEIRDIALSVGMEFRRDITLQVGDVQESISVVAELQQFVETTKVEVTSVVNQEQIAELPIEGRTALKLALLLPGTSEDGTRARRPGASVGVGGISLAGTNFIVDNMNNMTLRTGDSREDIPQAAVQEFRVIVSQYPAEFGGRVGGVINFVTKSGGNRFSGEAFEFFRNKNLNRMDKFQKAQQEQNGTPVPPFVRHQFGAALGGPIIKNRLHFFTTVERKDNREYFTVYTGKPEYYSSLEGTFRGGSVSNIFLGKIDAQLTPSHHVFYKYYKQPTSLLYAEGAGGQNAAFSAFDVGLPQYSHVVSHTWFLSARVANEFTGMLAHAYSDFSGLNEWYTPPQFRKIGSPRYNFPSMSWGTSPSTWFDDYYVQFRDALSINSGSHNWKIGGGVQWLVLYMDNPGNPNGTWTFNQDQYFNPSDPSFSFANLKGATQFTATVPRFWPVETSYTYEAYVQDAWKVRPNVTLNLGLRYDLQTRVWNERFKQSRYPRPLPYVDFASRGDKNNVAPRVGIAWDIHNDGRSVVRAAYGVIYTNAQHSILSGEGSAFQQYSINIRNPSYPDPYQGKDPLTFVSTAPPNISIGANNLVNAPAQTFNGGFSREFGSSAIHLDAVYTKIDKLPTNSQVNEPDPITKIVPLPEWGHISLRQPTGTYRYKMLMARFENRGFKRGQFLVSYTLGKQQARQGTITDHLHPEWDQGPADNDRRHNLATSGSILFPRDVTLGAVWTVRSSRPFSALAGRDLNADGSNSDFVPGTTINQGNRNLNVGLVNAWRAQNGLQSISADQFDRDTYNRLDVRGMKTITLGDNQRLELIGQLFNVLGRDNLGTVGVSRYNTNALSDSFGRILTAQPRQQAELAIRYVW